MIKYCVLTTADMTWDTTAHLSATPVKSTKSASFGISETYIAACTISNIVALRHDPIQIPAQEYLDGNACEDNGSKG